MITYYCNNCGMNTGHKRCLGFGTLFAVVLTCGLWLFMIPLYPQRCINCGVPFSGVKENPRDLDKDLYASALKIKGSHH